MLADTIVASAARWVQVGAERNLRTVIEGESLFNDGSAYVLFLLFLVSLFHLPLCCWEVHAQAPVA